MSTTPIAGSKRPKPTPLIPAHEAYLFFFKNERMYAMLLRSSTNLPKNINALNIGDSATIRYQGEYYSATLVDAGKLEVVKQKQQRLEGRLENHSDLSSLSFLNKSCSSTSYGRNNASSTRSSNNDTSRASEIGEPQNQPDEVDFIIDSEGEEAANNNISIVDLTPRPTPASTNRSNEHDNENLLSAINELRDAIRPLVSHITESSQVMLSVKREVKRLRSAITDSKAVDHEQIAPSDLPPVEYQGQNLAAIHANSPQELGGHLAKTLFSIEELKDGMLGRRRERANSRRPLSPTRSNLALEVIRRRFTNPSSQELARSAFNQVGLDHRINIKRGKRRAESDDSD